MKKLLWLALLCLSIQVQADCINPYIGNCPSVQCPKGSLMDNSGTCKDCNYSGHINVDCIGSKEAYKICPNRYTILNDCGPLASALSCLTAQEMPKEETTNHSSIIKRILFPFHTLKATYKIISIEDAMGIINVNMADHTCWYPHPNQFH